jgi:hypothetical protein
MTKPKIRRCPGTLERDCPDGKALGRYQVRCPACAKAQRDGWNAKRNLKLSQQVKEAARACEAEPVGIKGAERVLFRMMREAI